MPAGARCDRQRLIPLFRQPLIRLLAVNLAAGIGVAVLMFGGLLALLLFGLAITFGSTAMGTAIMALGARNEPPRGKAQLVNTERAANALHLSHAEVGYIRLRPF